MLSSPAMNGTLAADHLYCVVIEGDPHRTQMRSLLPSPG